MKTSVSYMPWNQYKERVSQIEMLHFLHTTTLQSAKNFWSKKGGDTYVWNRIYWKNIQPTINAITNRGGPKMEKIIELNIYDEEDLSQMLEEELIDDFEEAFMRGYLAG